MGTQTLQPQTAQPFDSYTHLSLNMHMHRKPHQFLEEVPDSLMVAPLLDTGEKSIVKLLVDLVELRHFEEDGFYLSHSEHRLWRCSGGLQRLHGLKATDGAGNRWDDCIIIGTWIKKMFRYTETIW